MSEDKALKIAVTIVCGVILFAMSMGVTFLYILYQGVQCLK